MTKMNNNIESLWPTLEEIGTSPYVAPVTILREQASAIRELTHNIIEGQVIQERILERDFESEKPGDKGKVGGSLISQIHSGLSGLSKERAYEVIEIDDRIRFSLFIRMPMLNGSRKKIITIEHDVSEFYPLSVSSVSNRWDNENILNEGQFKEILLDILRSEEIKAILQSFLAQSGYKQAA